MSNITLRVDDDVIRKVRKAAVERDTTLAQMVRDFLESVADREDLHKREQVRRLQRSFAEHSRPLGPRTWRREDLHER